MATWQTMAVDRVKSGSVDLVSFLRRDAVRFPLLVFLATRLALLALSFTGLAIEPSMYEEWGRPFLSGHPALTAFCRYDCGWYVRIADGGDSGIHMANWWPLFPLMGRWVAALTGLSTYPALLLVANGCALGAYLVVYRLFTQLSGPSAARWGLLAWCAYPFSFFHASVYPESLGMLATSAAVSLALAGRHWWAGLALGLGGLGRHIAVVTGAALLVAQFRQRGCRLRSFLLDRDVAALALPFLGILGFALFLRLEFNDALAFYHVRQGHDPKAWWNIITLLHNWRSEPLLVVYAAWSAVAIGGVVRLAWEPRCREVAVAGGAMMLALLLAGVWLLGRGTASCWPAFLGLGIIFAKRTNLGILMLVISAMFQGLIFYLWTHYYLIV